MAVGNKGKKRNEEDEATAIKPSMPSSCVDLERGGDQKENKRRGQ